MPTLSSALRALCLLSVLLVTACSTPPPGTGDLPRGQIAARWIITLQNQPATCAHVGAASVAIALHPRGAGADTTHDARFIFDCVPPAATTPPVVAGLYDVTLSLLSPMGDTIAKTEDRAVVSEGQTLTLGLASFDLADAHGTLVLSLAALGEVSNCHPSRGVAVATHTLILHDVLGGCVNARFMRAKNGAPNGLFVLNCASTLPKSIPCLEQDETLSVEGLDAGPYTVSVGSTSGGPVCWFGFDIVSVAASNTTRKIVQLEPGLGQGC